MTLMIKKYTKFSHTLTLSPSLLMCEQRDIRVDSGRDTRPWDTSGYMRVLKVNLQIW